MLFMLASILVLQWSQGVCCHPGEDIYPEVKARRDFLSRHPRTVQSCRQYETDRVSVIQRRAKAAKAANDIAPDHGIGMPFYNLGKPYYMKRDLSAVLSTDHDVGADGDIDELLLFSDYSNYALQPLVTPGPYFVAGELIRRDITESQPGIPMVLEMQFINTRTCLPMEELFVEVWQANATGTYSGVASPDNGDSLRDLDVDDKGTKMMTGGLLNESWLRGVQKTDETGVVQFKTIFPGWYTGRTTHIHLLVHTASSVRQLSNNTIASVSSGNHTVRASHVGQVFFDSTLLEHVAEMQPYKASHQWRIQNDEDAVLMQESAVSDPMVQYVMLGKQLKDGVFGWITIGIDPEVDVEVKVAASWFGSWGRMWRKLWL